MGSQWDAQGENFIECGQRSDTESPEGSAVTREVKGAFVQSNDTRKGNRLPGSGSSDMEWRAPGRAGCVLERREETGEQIYPRGLFVHVVFEHLKKLADYTYESIFYTKNLDFDSL